MYIYIYIQTTLSINYCLFIIKQSRFFLVYVYIYYILWGIWATQMIRLVVARRQSDCTGGGTDPCRREMMMIVLSKWRQFFGQLVPTSYTHPTLVRFI